MLTPGEPLPSVREMNALQDVPVATLQHAAGPHRTDRLGDLPDQLIAQLPRPAVAGQPGRHGRLDIPAGGLAVHPRLRGHRPQPGPGQPRPEHLTDLYHADLPEHHPPQPQVRRLGGI